MATHTINYTRTNPFFRDMEVNNVMSVTEMSDGTRKRTSYRRNMIPGASITKTIWWDEKKREYPITLSDEELTDIVVSLGFVDEKGERIVTADKKNKLDPFFTHDDLYYTIEGDVSKVDDSDPLVRLFLNYFGSKRSGVTFYDNDKGEVI